MAPTDTGLANMTGYRLLLHGVFLFTLPLIVAWLDLSLAGAIALVLLALIWRWAITLSALFAPARIPELELETISASHFVEKVRWCLDRLGVAYTEKPVGGTLGAFFRARSVPVLKFRTGMVRSSIGNSPEILRYLWGHYAAEAGRQAAFLEPTAERLGFEQEIDRCGVDLQVWVYYHILPDRDLTLHAWGAEDPNIPAWQRLSLRALFPLLRFMIRRVFRISPGHHAKAVEHVTALLAKTEESLADGRISLLGGDTINFTDITFASIMGLWLLPPAYGGGKAENVRIEPGQCPDQMQQEREDWLRTFPLTTAFIERLYDLERNTRTD